MIYIKRNKLMLYSELNFPLTKSGGKADDEHEFDRKSHCQFFTVATQIKMLLFPYSPKAGKISGRCDGEKHKSCAHYIAVVPEHDWRSCSHPTLTWRMRGTYRWRGKVGHWCHNAPDLFPATQSVVRAAVWRTESIISSSLYKDWVDVEEGDLCTTAYLRLAELHLIEFWCCSVVPTVLSLSLIRCEMGLCNKVPYNNQEIRSQIPFISSLVSV